MKTLIPKSMILLMFCTFSLSGYSQVGIGTSNPDASAMLDINDTTKGFLPPRMTEAQRDVISIPSNGLIIYNTDSEKLNYYNGTEWQVLLSNIPGNISDYVDTSSAQDIYGNKTFKGNIIADGRLMIPMGEISYYEFNPGFTVDITAQSTGALGNDNMVKIDPAGGGETVNFINDMFTASVAENSTVSDTRLKYTGATTRYFHIALSFSYKAIQNTQSYVFGVAKGNGAGAATVQNSSKLFTAAKIAGDSQSTAMHVLLKMDKDDYIEFWVGNLTSSSYDITILSMNFVAIGM